MSVKYNSTLPVYTENAVIEHTPSDENGVPLVKVVNGGTGGGTTGGLTDEELRASPVIVSADSITSLNTNVGSLGIEPAPADGSGNYPVLAALKRGLLNWATLLTRVPAPITPGLLPVDTLGTPGASRVLTTTAASQNIVLTSSCRRFSMYATTGTWYSLSGDATNTSHYIGPGERLDLDCAANTTVRVIQEVSAGSIRITELT